MKLPSLEYLARNATATLLRFPWVMAIAFVSTGLAIWFSEATHGGHGDHERLGHAVMASGLGISLCFGLSMLRERMRLSQLAASVLFLPALVMLAWYAYSMDGQSYFVMKARYALFWLASHLFVAVAPYLRPGYSRGFWEYNRSLFMRIIIAGIFSACLYAGLAAALLAVKHLFGLSVPNRVFFWLYLTVVGIFNTWFFLAGAPNDLEDLESDHVYPRSLQILTQYVLVPLVTLYLIILYAYAVKIVLGRQWPIGWVSYLVLICSLLGIFSLLLIHPIQERRENQWIKGFFRSFYYALFPLLILLFAAIGKRISEYRLTENRYFVMIMACWLTGIAVYFTLSRARNIKVVPITLGLLALFTSCGPWGAFQVSVKSQLGRLQDLLAAQGLYRNGRIITAAKPIDGEAEAQIGSVAEYLEKRKQLQRLRGWLADSLAHDDNAVGDKYAFLKSIGLKYVPLDRYGKIAKNSSINHAARTGAARRITGFDYVIPNQFWYESTQQVTLVPGPDSCSAQFFADEGKLRILLRDDSLLEFDFGPWLMGLKKEYPAAWNRDIPPEKMYLEGTARGYTVGLQVKEVSSQAGNKSIQNLTSMVLVKVPK